MQLSRTTSSSAQTRLPPSPCRAWQWIKAGSWLWQVNLAFAEPEFLKRLEYPERLLESPTRRIKVQEPARTALVAQVDLPEFPGFPLIVKRNLPRGWRQAAKSFFRRSRARKAFETALLHGRLRVPTATVIAAGENRRWGLLQETYLISALVPDTQTLHEVNSQCSDRTQRGRVVRCFARVIASLHDAGFSHTDPSLTNFLVREPGGQSPQMCVIDLDGLRLRRRFTERLVVKDLSRLLQRSHAVRHERLWFLAQYARARSPRVSARDLARKITQGMLAAGGGAGFKASHEFGIKTRGGLCWRVRRPLVTPQVEAILRAPDQFLETANVLKPSRSSAVSAQDGVVLKRYNFKKWRNLFKDLFRGSKARRCFFRAMQLERAGVPTARPLAFAEQRCWGVPLRSYLLMEEIPKAANLAEWQGDKRRTIQSLARLIARLHNAGFTHRDLKEGNILFAGCGDPFLVDLDGLRYVRRVKDGWATDDLSRLAQAVMGHDRASRTDCARFLQAYCRLRRSGDWRTWWREIGRKRTRA